MPKKLSKSNQPIEEQKAQADADAERMYKLLNQPMKGQEPGDGCKIVWSNGTSSKGIYTERSVSLWMSYCSAHRDKDEDCSTCAHGHWQDLADLLADQELHRTDYRTWWVKHNPHRLVDCGIRHVHDGHDQPGSKWCLGWTLEQHTAWREEQDVNRGR